MGEFLHPKCFPEIIESQLPLLQGEYRDVSYKVLNLGDHSGRLGYACEFEVPVGDGLQSLYDVMKDIFEYATENSFIAERYFSSAMGVRFTKESHGYLSMMHGSSLTASIEVAMISDTEGGLSQLRRLQRKLYHKYGPSGKFRCHWGLDLENFGRSYLKNCYPYFDIWESVYKQLNSLHTFDNAWTLRMGLDRIAINQRYDGKEALRTSREAIRSAREGIMNSSREATAKKNRGGMFVSSKDAVKIKNREGLIISDETKLEIKKDVKKDDRKDMVNSANLTAPEEEPSEQPEPIPEYNTSDEDKV